MAVFLAGLLQEYLLFKLHLVSLNQIKKILHISFRIAENLSSSNPQPHKRRKLGEDPTPGTVRMCKSPGVAGGGEGQAWN